MNQLFVYGTLCPNKANAHILEQIGGNWTKANVRGVIHILDWGPDKGLTAIVLDPKADWVEGYVFSTEKLEENWKMLDDFEGFQYQRVVTDVKLESGEQIKAWIYQLNAQAQGFENYN
ncbi:gamma-glutamylcyclotransferase family protein [Acinetobacter calcoaceticus]